MDADRAAIEKLHQDFGAAWSRGDAHGATSVYAEDGVRVGARGDIQHGRAEIEQAYVALFHGPFEGASVGMGAAAGPVPGAGAGLSAATIRLLGANYAVWQAPFTIVPANGPAVNGYAIDIMEKRNGRWWVLESHPKLFPPLPSR